MRKIAKETGLLAALVLTGGLAWGYGRQPTSEPPAASAESGGMTAVPDASGGTTLGIAGTVQAVDRARKVLGLTDASGNPAEVVINSGTEIRRDGKVVPFSTVQVGDKVTISQNSSP